MADVLPLPIARTGESAQELLLEQRDVLVRVENVLERSYSRLEIIQDVVAQSLGVQEQQLEMFRQQLENQEFANEEARREAARMRASSRVGPSGATAETTPEGDGPGFGALPALATGAVAGGLAASALRPQIRGLARRLLRGGGLIAIGSIFGETIGNFLGTEAAAILEDLGADPEFANQVGSAISGNAESALIGAGVSKLLLGRTLPGIIGGIIWNQLDLNRIFTEEGRDELTQGISDWFERARDGELTQEDIITGGLTGAAALYAGRKIQQGGAAVVRSFPTFRPDGTIEGEGQAARPRTGPAPQTGQFVRPRRPNGQFMSDAEIQEMYEQQISNAKYKRVFRNVIRGLAFLGVALTAYEAFQLYQILNSNASEKAKQEAIGAFIGGFVGALGGGAGGAALGAYFGPWGALIGAALGAGLGGFAGGTVGEFIAAWAFEEEPPVYQTEEQYQEFIQQNRERFEAGPNVGIIEGVTGDSTGAIQRTTPSYAEQFGFSPSAPTVTGTGATATPAPDIEPEITEEQKALVDQITGLMIDLEGLRAEEEIAREQYESSRGRNRRSAETRVDNLTDSIEELEEELEGLRTLLEGSTVAPSDVSFNTTTDGYRIYNAALGTSMNTGVRPIQAAFTPGFGSANVVRASLSTRGTENANADVDNILATIRSKESGGDYSATNFAWEDYVNSGGREGSSATGAYQFIKGTWNNLTDQYGIGQQYEFAKDAPANIQDEVARRYVEDILRRNNGNVGAVPNEWYTGNTAGVMSEAQLETNRGMTAAEYQADWLSRYAQIAGGNAPAQVQVPGTQIAQGGDMAAAQSMLGTIGGAIGGYGFDALFGEGTFANIMSSINPEQFIAEKLSGVFNRGQIGVTPAAMELNRDSEGATTAPIVVNAPQINNDNSVQASGGGGREKASQQLAIAPVGEQSATSTMRDWIDATFA